MAGMRVALRLVVLSAIVLSSLLLPGAAGGAFPGSNGRIAFITNRDADFEIYTMRPDGSDERNLTDAPGIDQDPAWSPDGGSLAFSRLRPGATDADVFRMRADGTGRVNLTRTPDARERSPVWSPNGRRIAFERELRILRIRSDGTRVKPVTAPAIPTAQQPTWAVLRGG
jgi:Tol biopolymer transport system component